MMKFYKFSVSYLVKFIAKKIPNMHCGTWSSPVHLNKMQSPITLATREDDYFMFSGMLGQAQMKDGMTAEEEPNLNLL